MIFEKASWEKKKMELCMYNNTEILSEVKRRMERNEIGQTELKTDETPIKETKKQYEAICSICNKPTTVPFKPTPGGSIKCKSCWIEAQR